MTGARHGGGVLYISYDGMAEPLGQSQVAPYLRGLATLGYRITLISFEKSVDRSDRRRMQALTEGLAGTGIRWIPLTYHKRPSLAATAFDVAVGLVRALAVCIRERVAVVHARSYVAGLIAWLLTRVVGAKFLFDMRGFWADERVEGGLWRHGGLLYRVVKRLERRFVRDADTIVTLTERSCGPLRTWIGPERVPITVIPTCVDLRKYSGLRSAGVPPVAPVFVYSGSLGTWYAGDEIIRFMAEALTRFPLARLVILTRNRAEAETSLAQSAMVSGATHVVTVEPTDVPNWLKSADVGLAFYAPGFSRQATCPTKAGEYLAMGVPVVVGVGVGDMEEIVSAHQVGAALTTYSASAYRAALDRLMDLWSDPDLGSRCRDVATRRFGLDVGIARYDAVYRSLGAERAPGAVCAAHS
jgi:glycosyltransferase involved in cell wall biosynthesis